jgi:hypothetical protein
MVEQTATTLTEMVLGGLEVPTTQAAGLKPRDYMLASNRSHVWRLCQFVHSFHEPPVSSDQRYAGGHKTAPTVLKEKTHV